MEKYITADGGKESISVSDARYVYGCDYRISESVVIESLDLLLRFIGINDYLIQFSIIYVIMRRCIENVLMHLQKSIR